MSSAVFTTTMRNVRGEKSGRNPLRNRRRGQRCFLKFFFLNNFACRPATESLIEYYNTRVSLL